MAHRHPSDDDLPVSEGMPLPLRILAGVGALSFILMGLNGLVPLLRQPKRPTFPPLPPDSAAGEAAKTPYFRA